MYNNNNNDFRNEEDFKKYDDFRKYDDHKKCYDHKKKDSKCCDECVKTLAEQLEKYKCEYVAVFEKDAVVIGRVKAVINDSVLVLVDGIKFVEGIPFFIPFDKIFISICAIKEFIPFTADQATTALEGIRNSGRKCLL
ncbi:hypothetical protein [Clostridium cylindrosporum]|uniref:Uncharacterized protein n=1 Tax=Clostridium cylindrosporum DSM 605 TaxID=1121307 RepID=A0A0J8G243_CLOCY|nr:hypothetical protein [Clostridium cylindrosporum]KMT21821.1 hypothetical protein CLCY_3c00880 [Clostridium cylindrosporum DSM 605]